MEQQLFRCIAECDGEMIIELTTEVSAFMYDELKKIVNYESDGSTEMDEEMFEELYCSIMKNKYIYIQGSERETFIYASFAQDDVFPETFEDVERLKNMCKYSFLHDEEMEHYYFDKKREDGCGIFTYEHTLISCLIEERRRMPISCPHTYQQATSAA